MASMLQLPNAWIIKAWSTPYCQGSARHVPGTAKSVHIYRHMPCSAQFLSCLQWWRMPEFSDGELAIIVITPWGLAHDWNVANSYSHAWHMLCQARSRQNIFWFDRDWHGKCEYFYRNALKNFGSYFAWHVPSTCLQYLKGCSHTESSFARS